MAQTGSARAASWIPEGLQGLIGGTRLTGHVDLLSTPTYRHIVKAEPLLRRSIPVLIITFVAVLALTRLVGVMETRRTLEDGARDGVALISATLAAELARPDVRLADVGYEAATRAALSDAMPLRSTGEGRHVVVADGDGKIRTIVPRIAEFEGLSLSTLLAEAPPLTMLGARAGVLETKLPDGRAVWATVHHIDGGAGSVAAFQIEEEVFAEWRRSLRTNVTLFVFTAIILLVLTYAYFVQALRANSADALYAMTASRTETAFRRGRCGFWDWDLARGRFFWSASMFEMLGLEQGQGIVGFRDVLALVHPSDIDFVTLANKLLAGEIHTLDRAFRLRKADGGWLWFRVRAEVSDRPETGSRHLVGIAADITEHRRLLEHTVTQDMRLRDAIETISEAFVLWDADNRLVMCNSKYQQLHGLDGGDVRLGTPYDEVMKRAKQPLVSGPAEDEETPADGSRSFEAEIEGGRWLQINERRTKDGGFVSVGTDITDLKRHEERLMESEKQLMGTVADLRKSRRKLEVQAQQLVELADKYAEEKARAEEANKIKSDFLANISHELRTPLNAIIGFSEIMCQGVGAFGPDKYAEYSHDIHDSGMFLLNVINDILDMSKIEAGRMTLAQDPVELDGILDETCRIISHAAEEKSLHVVTEVEPGLAFVGDRRAMKQVILNLFSNAVKFTPEGGRVSLAAKTAEREVVVTISDTGIGIPPDRIATLGRPFVQVENQFTKSHKGSGLGLAIARSLIELQGGEMDIASEPGQGTTVTLRLPIERVGAPVGEVDAAA